MCLCPIHTYNIAAFGFLSAHSLPHAARHMETTPVVYHIFHKMMRLPLKDGRTEAMDSSQQPRPITYSSSSRPSDVEDEHHDQPSSSPAEGQHDIESGVGDSHASQMEDDDLTEPQQGQYPRNKKLYTRSTAAAFRSSLPIYHRGVDKVIGLKDAPTLASARFRRQQFLRNQPPQQQQNSSVDNQSPGPSPLSARKTMTMEEKEMLARQGEITNPIFLFYLSMVAAIKVMVCFLITAETVLTCVLTAGMIVYWHNYGLEHADGLRPWSGSGMEFVVLVFAVTTPVSHRWRRGGECCLCPNCFVISYCIATVGTVAIAYLHICIVTDCNCHWYGLYSTGRGVGYDCRLEEFGASPLYRACSLGLERERWKGRMQGL